MVIGGSARALFRVFAASKVKEGWGGSRIYRATKGTVMGVQKKWGLAQVREFSGLWKWEKVVAATPRNEFIPRFAIVDLPYEKERRYRFFGTANFIDPETGEESSRSVSFFADRMKDEEELEAEYRDILKKPEYEGVPTLTGFKLRSGQHKQGWAW